MATSKGFHDYVLEQLSDVPNITCRPMMGGYLLYADGILFGGFYGGDRMLVKITETNTGLGLPEAIPYEGSKKMMYLVEDIDDRDRLAEIVNTTVAGLQ